MLGDAFGHEWNLAASARSDCLEEELARTSAKLGERAGIQML